HVGALRGSAAAASRDGALGWEGSWRACWRRWGSRCCMPLSMYIPILIPMASSRGGTTRYRVSALTPVLWSLFMGWCAVRPRGMAGMAAAATLGFFLACAMRRYQTPLRRTYAENRQRNHACAPGGPPGGGVHPDDHPRAARHGLRRLLRRPDDVAAGHRAHRLLRRHVDVGLQHLHDRVRRPGAQCAPRQDRRRRALFPAEHGLRTPPGRDDPRADGEALQACVNPAGAGSPEDPRRAGWNKGASGLLLRAVKSLFPSIAFLSIAATLLADPEMKPANTPDSQAKRAACATAARP